MAFKKIVKVQTQDDDINKLQDSIAASVDPILSKPWLDSQVLTGITLVQGQTNAVPHKLGRKPYGSNVIYSNTQYDVWNVKASDNLCVYLTCSATVTVDLIVF